MIDSEQIIRKYVALDSLPSARGWYPIKCQLCNDYKVRAGFIFSGDGFGYNCFNCATQCTFKPSESLELSRNTRKVLVGYGIPESEFNDILYRHIGDERSVSAVDDSRLKIDFPNITLPKFFKPLDPTNIQYPIEELACLYLQEDRGIDPTTFPFYICDPTARSVAVRKWKNRLIIPINRKNQTIFFQGRNLLDDGRIRYESCAEPKECVIGNIDRLYEHSRDPIYVTEGFFDSYHINGVYTIGNRMTEQQIFLLNSTSRPKIVVPDLYGNGRILAQQALEQGWSIALPDIGTCKDVNEAIVKYGLLYVITQLRDQVYSGDSAEIALNLNCQ